MLDWKYRPREERAADPVQSTETGDAKPEGFASKNVKIITFVVCIAVFLILFGPLNVFHIWDRVNDGKIDGKPLTQSEVILLSQKGARLTMNDLRQYSGQITENGYRVIYTAEFDRYMLLAIEDLTSRQLISCVLTDTEVDRSVNIMTEDVAAFFAEAPSA